MVNVEINITNLIKHRAVFLALSIKIIININSIEFSLIENKGVFCSFAYHLQSVCLKLQII